MKSRFTTIDIAAVIAELNEKYLGMRVANVYDIDNKTYLIKLQKPDFKAMILLESGIRIHSTEFNWPKNMMPSGFSMKMRKHLRTRRLESVQQLGADRIVDFQFGSGEAAYHVIIELYDRGNMVLTDYEFTILNLLRARTDDSQDVRFAVREKYPVELARQHEGVIKQERLMAVLMNAKDGDNLKKTLNPHLEYGPALIEHVLLCAGLPSNAAINKGFTIAEDMPRLIAAMQNAEEILQSVQTKKSNGFIIQKKELKAVINPGEPQEELLTYQEFHPMLFRQHEGLPHKEVDSFDHSVDEFFSQIGSQKLDIKALQQEKAAIKKLDNVKKDHEKRISALQGEQDTDTLKAQLIEINLTMVDRAILVVNTALANQVDWQDIEGLVKEAQGMGDFVASSIKSLKLDTNHITLLLKDPYMEEADDDEEDSYIKPMKVDIDLSLSAYANARKYYDMKKHAVIKEQKTIEASGKALKSAERKTKETLKEMKTVATINKARKTHWFEKFLWFVTSENYVVIGGRDQQQNEIIVKKYMRPGDLYVHADLHGASSCVIKNARPDEPIPPKSLNEAGTMALCNSAAWDARVVTSAWWVHSHQVSKTAPSGEYLTTGSFMIRGKKNYLPPSYLIYGFGFVFKLDETSIFRHKDERKVKTIEEDTESVAESTDSSDAISDITMDMEEIDSGEDSDDEDSVEDAHTSHTTRHAHNSQQQSTSVSKKIKEAESSSDSDDGDSRFPDTSLRLHQVKGGKFELRKQERSISWSSHTSQEDEINLDEQVIAVQKASGRLTAKQRREMKKPKKSTDIQNNEDTSIPVKEDVTSRVELEDEGQENEPDKGPNKDSKSSQPQQHPPKRGQKTKLKKMKEKYGDQDEEDRELMMEMLGSAGAPKEDKKKNKKKNKQKEAQRLRNEKAAEAAATGKPQLLAVGGKNILFKKGAKLTLEDIKVDTLSIDEKSSIPGDIVPKPEETGVEEGYDSDEEKQAILEEENIKISQDADILDSLTGQPVLDDLLLFAIPVCAPYSCLVNYKYKVKLLPGNTKRGKAAKTALNMFQHDKTATQREKDLFKSLKDVDLSRNMPGKVKVSAPNIQKSKKR